MQMTTEEEAQFYVSIFSGSSEKELNIRKGGECSSIDLHCSGKHFLSLLSEKERRKCFRFSNTIQSTIHWFASGTYALLGWAGANLVKIPSPFYPSFRLSSDKRRARTKDVLAWKQRSPYPLSHSFQPSFQPLLVPLSPFFLPALMLVQQKINAWTGSQKTASGCWVVQPVSQREDKRKGEMHARPHERKCAPLRTLVRVDVKTNASHCVRSGYHDFPLLLVLLQLVLLGREYRDREHSTTNFNMELLSAWNNQNASRAWSTIG